MTHRRAVLGVEANALAASAIGGRKTMERLKTMGA
jgi:hypothetical protein